MSRLARLLAVAAVCLSLAAVPASGAPVAGSLGKDGTCVWKKKSKRIVKHVRRDGKKRKVVRVKRYWRCVPLAQPAILPPPVAPGPTPPLPPTVPEPPAPSRLGVESFEWSYTLSRPSVVAGDLIVELNNSGEDPHNLNIAPGDGADNQTGPALQTIEAVGPGMQGSARFSIAPGTYYLFCSLPTHEGLGMHTNLTVTP